MVNILDYIDKMQEMYEGKPSSMAQEPRNMFADGQLVQPSGDGSRPGYSGEKYKKQNLKSKPGTNEYAKEYYKKNKNLTDSGKLASERDIKIRNFIGNKKTIKSSELRPFLEGLGYNKIDYTKIKKKFPNLKIINDVARGNIKGETTKYNKNQLNIANRYANLLNKRGPKDQHYVNAKKYMDLDDKGKKKIQDIMTRHGSKFNKDFSKSLRFSPKIEKLIMEQFNLTENDFIKHGKYGTPLNIDGKRNPKYTSIINFAKKDFKIPKVKSSEIITLEQQKKVMDNFELPKGQEWNFKSKENPNGFKYGVSGAKNKNASLAKRIDRFFKDKVKYTIAADNYTPKGWMMNAMNRLYENEIKNNVKFKDLTYQPKFNDEGIITGFKDNTATGQGRTFYGLKKNMREDGTEWRAHGDFNKVNKFLNIANGAKEEPGKILTKILSDKGITNLMGETSTLTLNDVLSHERFYNKLSETKPSELIKRQIVLHHEGGVGAGTDVARAAATKDIQLLTAANNARVKKLESIVQGTKKNPARNLNADEILELKNMNAKIKNLSGKTVGGGYTDPTKQFAAIEKKALEYAKGDQFNIKTVANYLERLGCGGKFGGGGRILMSNGGATLTKCAKAGQQKLTKGLTNGFGSKTEGELAKRILQAGKGLKNMVALRNILGPAAIGFTVAAEAGLVGYDMLATGKSFKEAVGASLFNYALGDKTKIDNKKLRYQGYADAGVSANQIGKISAYENAMDEMNNTFAEFDKENELYNAAVTGGPRMSDAVKQKQIKNYYDQADKNKALIQDLARTQTESRLDKALDPMVPAIMSDADAKRKAMQLTKPSTVGFGNFMDTVFPSGFFSDTTYKEDRDKAVNYMPEVQEYYRGNRFAKGGLSGGDTSGPPPESGPMSQGLRSLIKNGRKP
jgi:hypothetical protein